MSMMVDKNPRLRREAAASPWIARGRQAGLPVRRRVCYRPKAMKKRQPGSSGNGPEGRLGAAERARVLGQRGSVVWLTGLPGAGKSTLAHALERHLFGRGHLPFVLDGDDLRAGLCSDLGFSPAARHENIRRVGHVAALLADAGLITIVSFISPYRAGRRGAREAVGADRFIEVFLDVPPEVCASRDPKGLWARARAGELEGFTGVDAPYERPEAPDLVLPTGELSLEECVAGLVARLEARGMIPVRGEGADG